MCRSPFRVRVPVGYGSQGRTPRTHLSPDTHFFGRPIPLLDRDPVFQSQTRGKPGVLYKSRHSVRPVDRSPFRLPFWSRTGSSPEALPVVGSGSLESRSWGSRDTRPGKIKTGGDARTPPHLVQSRLRLVCPSDLATGPVTIPVRRTQSRVGRRRGLRVRGRTDTPRRCTKRLGSRVLLSPK